MTNWADVSILIVDDEPALVETLEAEFEMVGCRKIFKSFNGEHALRVFQENAIDLVISDIRMPRSDGVALLKDIKRLRPDFRGFHFMTGYADIEKVGEFLHMGARTVFRKPFDVDKMLNSLLANLDETAGRTGSRSDEVESLARAT
jgi:DNA-binding NtrC family response regulator